MKLLKKSFISLVLLCTMLLATVQVSHAASFSVSAGQSTVSVGRTVSFTITVPAGCQAWTYSVSYSGNLTLQSGDLAPMGFEGYNRVNQLVFRANDTGTGTVWISKGSFSMDGTNNETPSGSASVTIVSASTPDDSEPDYTPSESANNALSTLTVSAGTLTPAFDPAVTEYTLSLPQGTEKLTLTATPSDSKATVQGGGEVTLQPGENKLSLVVTAENGDTKTYTITAKVAQAPTLFFNCGGAKLGVVKDVEGVTPPTGFAAAAPVSHGGDTLPIWVDANGKHTLVYLVDEQGVAGFYLYSQTEGVLSPYLPLAYGGATYIYTGIPADKAVMPGLEATAVEAFSQTLSGWRYEDAAMADFVVLYLMDGDGQYGYYTYDTKNATLQRFNGAVYADDGQTLAVPMLYVYIAGGTAALLLILMIVFACVSGSRGKKLRALAAEQTEPAEEAAPEALPEAAETPAEEPEAEFAPAEETKEPEAPAQEATPAEEAAPEETPEPTSEQPEAPTEEETPEPAPAEEPATSEPQEPATPEAPAKEPAPEEAPPAQPEAPAEDKSLEDTLRKLPLDELLQDIRDL